MIFRYVIAQYSQRSSDIITIILMNIIDNVKIQPKKLFFINELAHVILHPPMKRLAATTGVSARRLDVMFQ